MARIGVDSVGPYRLVGKRSGPKSRELVKVHALRVVCAVCGGHYWTWPEDELETCANCRLVQAWPLKERSIEDD